jgi:hypothetical protein
MAYPINVRRSQEDTARANEYLGRDDSSSGPAINHASRMLGWQKKLPEGSTWAPGQGAPPWAQGTKYTSPAAQVAPATAAVPQLPTVPAVPVAPAMPAVPQPMPVSPTDLATPALAKRPQPIGPQPTGYRKRGGRAKK